MRSYIAILFLLAGCAYPSEPDDAEFVYRYFVFSMPSEWDSIAGQWKRADTQMLLCANGRFINTSNRDYAAFPRLKLRYRETGRIYRVFDGKLGLTATEDWSQYIPNEDRFQPLVVVFDTIRANSEARIKVLTGWFYMPRDVITIELVFVINGEEKVRQPYN